MEHRKHIFEKPDTYVGSCESETIPTYVYNETESVSKDGGGGDTEPGTADGGVTEGGYGRLEGGTLDSGSEACSGSCMGLMISSVEACNEFDTTESSDRSSR